MNKFLITLSAMPQWNIPHGNVHFQEQKNTLPSHISFTKKNIPNGYDVGVNEWISGWNDCTFYEYSWGHLSHPMTMVGLNIVRVYQKDTAFPWTNGCIHFPVALYLIDKHENFLWIFANGCGKFMECIQFYQVLSESFEKLWLKPL